MPNFRRPAGDIPVTGDLPHTRFRLRSAIFVGIVETRQHPVRAMAVLTSPGALTRASPTCRCPQSATVAAAVAIRGDVHRVTREPPKGPLVTAPHTSVQSF